MGIIKRGMHGDVYETFEEAVAAGTGGRWPQSIYHDFETDGYWCDGSDGYTVFNLRHGGAYHHDPIARVHPNGTVVHLEPKMLPGDIEFSKGDVYTVVAVGEARHKRYFHVRTQGSVRMPSFRKMMRDQGYEIVSENVEKRHAVARKERD